MCQTNDLASMMSTFKWMSIIDIVFAVTLIIAGAVAASYSVPKWCDDPLVRAEDGYSAAQCEEDYNTVNDFLKIIALWGTLPAVVPFICGILGVMGATQQSKGIVGCCLAMAIVGIILCSIGFLLPYVGAAVVSTICSADEVSGLLATDEGRDFCDRYGGGLWAVVILNVILGIYQLAFSIVLCSLCCASPAVWAQKSGGIAPDNAPGGMPGTAAPVGIPLEPVNATGGQWNQTQPQQEIPVAQPVRMS